MDRLPHALKQKPQVSLEGYLPPWIREGPRGFAFLVYWKSRKDPLIPMKAGIHPAYNEINVICACGHTFKTRSTHKGDIRVEICSSCHPFFTGRQKLMDTAGRVDRFERKYKVSRAAKKAAQPTSS